MGFKQNYRFIELVRTDLVQAKILKEHDHFTYLNWLVLFFKKRSCRIQSFVRWRKGNVLVAFISKLFLDRFFIEIGRQTKIEPYFFMPHPRCIIIANNVVIGEHVHVAQYVTIGGNFKKTKSLPNGDVQKVPSIGNKVSIHPGAVIGGPVTIKDEVIVGANAVITRDVPSNSIVIGQNKLIRKNITIPAEGGSYKLK